MVNLRFAISLLASTSLALLIGWGAGALLPLLPAQCGLAPSEAQAQMSKDESAMRAKSDKLNAEARARTRAATERMHRILQEKRQGKRGFPDDFNTVPGDKKR